MPLGAIPSVMKEHPIVRHRVSGTDRCIRHRVTWWLGQISMTDAVISEMKARPRGRQRRPQSPITFDERICYVYWRDFIKGAVADCRPLLDYLRTLPSGGFSYGDLVRLEKRWASAKRFWQRWRG
jgi:hypothetical protein